jgi:hypothetical protein
MGFTADFEVIGIIWSYVIGLPSGGRLVFRDSVTSALLLICGLGARASRPPLFLLPLGGPLSW